MATAINRYLHRQNFNPGFLGAFINPFFFTRKGLMNGIKTYAPRLTGSLLDVGCGKKPYQHLFQTTQYIGMDIENPGHDHTNEMIDVYYDGKTFPFGAETFESVLTSEVFEHVFNPDEFLKEIHRVMKKDGMLLLTAPFVWDEHEQPNDYARYSSFGLTHMLSKNGFEVVSYTKSVSDLRVIFQLFALYLYKKIYTKNRVINALLTILFISPITCIGIIISAIFPGNSDLYLTNIVLAKKIDRTEGA